jgi:hypothetical protein
MTENKRRITGAGLIIVGTLFLFVTNRILIGWEHVWPLFPIAAGVLMLRAHRAKGNADILFAGLLGLLLGAFLLLFSVGILDWTQMAVLWPTIPLIVGGAMLAGRLTREERGTIVLEVGIVLFGLIAFLFTTERINPRVAAPFVRFWPLVLIVAGFVVLKLQATPSNLGAPDPEMEAVRSAIENAETDGDTGTSDDSREGEEERRPEGTEV